MMRRGSCWSGGLQAAETVIVHARPEGATLHAVIFSAQ